MLWKFNQSLKMTAMTCRGWTSDMGTADVESTASFAKVRVVMEWMNVKGVRVGDDEMSE